MAFSSLIVLASVMGSSPLALGIRDFDGLQRSLSASVSVSGASGAKADLVWETNEFGSRSCGEEERQEFQRIFGTLPSETSRMDVWSLEQAGTVTVAQLAHEPKALIIYPDVDPNGAFTIGDWMCYRLLSLARIYPDTKLVHVSTVDEASAVLEGTPDAAVEHLVIGGHGTPSSLELGPCLSDICTLSIYTPRAERFWKLVDRKLLPGSGRVFLDACKNGQEDGDEDHNNAKYVATLVPGHRVYSSKISFSRKNLVINDFKSFDLHVRTDHVHNGQALDDIQNFVNVKNCRDWQDEDGREWQDEDGRDCEAYAKGGLCLHASVAGAGELTAKQACCACGGGGVAPQEQVCPPSSKQTPHGKCICFKPEAQFYRLGQLQETPMEFPPGEASQVECRDPQQCPAGSGGSLMYGLCHCIYQTGQEKQECFKGDSVYPGCGVLQGRGINMTNFFEPDCVDCKCKPARQPQVECKNGICTCPTGMECFKGDRKGCPLDANFVAAMAEGPVVLSTNSFAESCTMCSCHMQCPGAVQGNGAADGVLSSRKGFCKCDQMAECFAGFGGTCPANWEWDGIDMFKCPDCYCGLKSGAPTKMGGTCTMGMNQGGRECTRPDGCCNPRKHPNGPKCLTVDPSSAGLAFKMDYCTAQGELPYKWVAMSKETCRVRERDMDSNVTCGGKGRMAPDYKCMDAMSGTEASPYSCWEYATMPALSEHKCMGCENCPVASSTKSECDPQCQDREENCPYEPCAGCAVCLKRFERIRSECAAQSAQSDGSS